MALKKITGNKVKRVNRIKAKIIIMIRTCMKGFLVLQGARLMIQISK